MDLSILCRSCMKEVASWEKENFNQMAIDMFCYCTNIEITGEDKLPKQFCYDCFIKIESSYAFIKEAQRVNITLGNLILRKDSSIIVETDSYELFVKSDSKNNAQGTHIKCENVSKVDSQLDGNNLKENNKTEDENDYYDSKIYNINSSSNCISCSCNLSQQDCICSNKNLIECNAKIADIKTQEQKPHVCAVCMKGFAFKAWLNRHISREHSGDKFTCTHCEKTFTKMSQLKQHTLCHSEERQFSCSECTARFKRRKELTAHARTHSDVRPHACTQCPMRFKVKSVLISHMKLHKGEKPYLCSICGWGFVQAGNLHAHLRAHAGRRPRRVTSVPRRCALCVRTFCDASSLTRHIRTHSGECPFKCPYCPRSFIDSWKRKSHLMRQHKLALADIPKLPRDPTATVLLPT